MHSLSHHFQKSLLAAVVGMSCSLSVSAEEKIFRTSTGKGADAEVRENANNSGHDAGVGANEMLNIRYDPTAGKERNEVVLLRFDLTGLQPADVASAQLQLTLQSPLTSANGLQVYALKPTAKNQNWAENGVQFSSAPGLKWDDNFTTRGLVEEDTILLGVLPVPASEAGAVLTFADDKLTALLQDSAWSTRGENPNLVTFILMLEKPNSGQRRIVSKEAADENDVMAPRLVITTK